jgi:hypothetical protein
MSDDLAGYRSYFSGPMRPLTRAEQAAQTIATLVAFAKARGHRTLSIDAVEAALHAGPGTTPVMADWVERERQVAERALREAAEVKALLDGRAASVSPPGSAPAPTPCETPMAPRPADVAAAARQVAADIANPDCSLGEDCATTRSPTN